MKLVVLAWLTGCSPARREVQTDVVRRIRFEGNGGAFSGHNNLQLRSAMDQRQSPPLTLTFPFMYFTQPAALDRDTIATDAKQLEVWYAHHGWFDASFLGWEVRRVRARDEHRAGVVDLLGHVEPGPISEVTSIKLTGVNKRDGTETIARSAMQGSELQVGSQFDLGRVQQTRKAIEEAIQDNGFAWARVEPTMDAWPEEHRVDVEFHVTPSVVGRFGHVTIVGREKVSESIVLDSLTFDYLDPNRPGDTSGKYRISQIRESQQRLFDTGLFSLVDIRLDPDAQPGDTAPIIINLREAKFRRFRISGGLQFDYFLLSPRLTAEYRDLRFAGSNLETSLSASIGAVIGIVRSDASQNIPWFLTGGGGLRFNYPWLLRRKLALAAGASARRDLQFGSLPYWSLQGDFGMVYAFTPDIRFTAGPKFEYFHYFDLTSEQEQAAQVQFGPDFTSTTYRLLSLDMGLLIDWRDDPLSPHRGSYWSLGLRQSIPIPSFDGNDTQAGFLYSRIDGEVRAWYPFRLSQKDRRLPWVLGGRLRGRWLIPWRGPDDALPYPDMAFMGGPNSLRGFRTNMAGPYAMTCAYDDLRPIPPHNNGEPYNVSRTYLPTGGALSVEANAELRYDWRYGLSFAVFGDVGLLTHRLADFSDRAVDPVRDMLRYDGGVGLRYASPIGPIRIDLGLRPLFPEDTATPSQAFDCNTIDTIPRGFDLFSSSIAARERLLDPGGREVPLAINLFLAIGEAF